MRFLLPRNGFSNTCCFLLPRIVYASSLCLANYKASFRPQLKYMSFPDLLPIPTLVINLDPLAINSHGGLYFSFTPLSQL